MYQNINKKVFIWTEFRSNPYTFILYLSEGIVIYDDFNSNLNKEHKKNIISETSFFLFYQQCLVKFS